ncbi:MAG: type III-A CRISPR-associated RAMP protein Csm5 [Truepera sp.]|nr:type III-A CRISPR-associated RAMP protein Csm5 [Truepera sp.]
MTTYRLRLTPLTPIHVGSGELLEPYAYALKGDTAFALSLPKLVETLKPIERERYFKALSRGPLDARDEVQTLLRNLRPESVSSWTAKTGDSFRRYATSRLEARTAKLEVRLLPRTPQGAYLPGSSLKGAIRSALLAGELQRSLGHERDLEFRNERWQTKVGRGRIRIPRDMQRQRGRWMKANQLLEAYTLHYEVEGKHGPRANISADPLRTLALSDSTPLPGTRFAQLEVWGSRKSPDAPTGISLLAEVWDEGSVEATLRLNEGFQQRSILKLDYRPSLAQIAASAYDRYATIAGDELELYDERGWDTAADLMDEISTAIEGCLSDGEFKPPFRFPLRLGFGAGATSLHLAEFTDEAPASRKLCEGKPLGWLMVEVL